MSCVFKAPGRDVQDAREITSKPVGGQAAFDVSRAAKHGEARDVGNQQKAMRLNGIRPLNGLPVTGGCDGMFQRIARLRARLTLNRQAAVRLREEETACRADGLQCAEAV